MTRSAAASRLGLRVFAPRHERALEWLIARCYRIAEDGPVGWLGDRLDDTRDRLFRRRCARRGVG